MLAAGLRDELVECCSEQRGWIGGAARPAPRSSCICAWGTWSTTCRALTNMKGVGPVQHQHRRGDGAEHGRIIRRRAFARHELLEEVDQCSTSRPVVSIWPESSATAMSSSSKDIRRTAEPRPSGCLQWPALPLRRGHRREPPARVRPWSNPGTVRWTRMGEHVGAFLEPRR